MILYIKSLIGKFLCTTGLCGVLLLLYTSQLQAQNSGSVRIIEPKKDVPVAKSAAIDDEQFELGLFAGFLSIEEFNTNPVWGASLTYHIAPRFIAQINYGFSEIDRSNTEADAGEGINFVSTRDVEYYNILAGYRLLRGRSFIGKQQKYNSDLYLLLGVGSLELSDNSNSSIVFGTSYRTVLTDELTFNIDFRGHLADLEFANTETSSFNTELSFGLNFLF